MEIDQIKIGLNTVTKSLIDFDEVEIGHSTVNVEINENGLNIDDFKQGFSTSGEKSSSKAEDAIKVIVQKARFQASTINTNVTFLDRNIASITMPNVSFRNIGKGGKVTASDALT